MPTSDQEHLTEISDLNIRSLDILARALHVKSAELEPTLQTIVSTAVRMLSPARYAWPDHFYAWRAHPAGLH